MPKHRQSVPASGVEITRRPGLVQLVTGAVSCLLGLAGLTIAINTATGNDGPPVDTTNSSHSGPPSGLDGASMPSVVPASPTPSESEATSDATDEPDDADSDASDTSSDEGSTSGDSTDDSTNDPTPAEPATTPTTSPDEPGDHGKPKNPGKPR